MTEDFDFEKYIQDYENAIFDTFEIRLPQINSWFRTVLETHNPEEPLNLRNGILKPKGYNFNPEFWAFEEITTLIINSLQSRISYINDDLQKNYQKYLKEKEKRNEYYDESLL